jgi:hypothetical protein
LGVTQRRSWEQVGVLGSGGMLERFWNAGLSDKGAFCFVTDLDDYWCWVYSRIDDKVIWEARGYPELPRLSEWQKDGFVEIEDREARGRYRLFSLGENNPIEINEEDGILIITDTASDELVIVDNVTGEEFQRLKYKAFSGDWAFATFSDDGSVIAVVEPYYVTFFARASSSAISGDE